MNRRQTILWMLVVLAASLWCWAAAPRVAEALEGWTARLAAMVLADYPPGYGETHYGVY